MVVHYLQLSASKTPRPSVVTAAAWKRQNLPASCAWHMGLLGEGTGQNALLHKQCRYNTSCGRVQKTTQGVRPERDLSGWNENKANTQKIQVPIAVFIIYNIELITLSEMKWVKKW